MSAICYKCQRHLPNNWTIVNGEMPEDSWHMTNVAPHAASGGVMMPVCKKCDPDPLRIMDRYRDAVGQAPAVDK